MSEPCPDLEDATHPPFLDDLSEFTNFSLSFALCPRLLKGLLR